jgi:hypothetical protein
MMKVLIVALGAAIAIVATFLGNNALSNAENTIATLSSHKDRIKTNELNEVNDLSSASHADANAVYLFYLITAAQKQLPSTEIYMTIALDESEAIQRAQRAAGFNQTQRIDPNELRALVNSVTEGNPKSFEKMRHLFQYAQAAYGRHIGDQNAEADRLNQDIAGQESSVQRLRLQISLVQILGIIVALFKDVVPDPRSR